MKYTIMLHAIQAEETLSVEVDLTDAELAAVKKVQEAFDRKADEVTPWMQVWDR